MKDSLNANTVHGNQVLMQSNPVSFKENKIYNINLKKWKKKELEIFDHVSFNKKYNKYVLAQILLFALFIFSVILVDGASRFSILLLIIFVINLFYLYKKSYDHVCKKEIDIRDNDKIQFFKQKLNLNYIFDFKPRYRVELYNSDNKYKTIYFWYKKEFNLFKANMEKL